MRATARIQYNPAADRHALELHQQGRSNAEIARALNVSPTWVTRSLERSGIQPKQVGHPAKKDFDDEEVEFLRACLLYQQQTGQRPSACDYLKILKGMGYRRG